MCQRRIQTMMRQMMTVMRKVKKRAMRTSVGKKRKRSKSSRAAAAKISSKKKKKKKTATTRKTVRKGGRSSSKTVKKSSSRKKSLAQAAKKKKKKKVKIRPLTAEEEAENIVKSRELLYDHLSSKLGVMSAELLGDWQTISELLHGWKLGVHRRTAGSAAGTIAVSFCSPHGTSYKSRSDVSMYVLRSLFGNKNFGKLSKGVARRISKPLLDRLHAHRNSVSSLNTEVRRLPAKVGGIVVNNMGVPNSQYCEPGHIWPIGFCTTRHEFSPVHGRIIKIRCDIIEGEEDEEIGKKNPIFRIRWGKRIEEEKDVPVRTFFSSSDREYHAASHMSRDVLSPPTEEEYENQPEKPVVGMRARVRFDKKYWYGGTIKSTSVNEKGCTLLKIEYDDEFLEEIQFPDMDVMLEYSDVDHTTLAVETWQHWNDIFDEEEPDHLDDFHNKTVVGKTPLEAWGKALTALHMIDDDIRIRATEGFKTYVEQEEAEAKEKQEAQRQAQRLSRKKAREQQQRGGGEQEDSHDEEMDDDGHGESNVSQLKEDGAFEEGEEIQSEMTDREPISEEESLLMERIEALEKKRQSLFHEVQALRDEVADANIEAEEGLNNPFKDITETQMSLWLGTMLRKEKAKQGGRKNLNALDLLKKYDSFFNPDIERLIEGLPGAQLCHDYIFKECRNLRTAKAWKVGSQDPELEVMVEQMPAKEEKKPKSKRGRKNNQLQEEARATKESARISAREAARAAKLTAEAEKAAVLQEKRDAKKKENEKRNNLNGRSKNWRNLKLKRKLEKKIGWAN
mmetsp:Transcript_15582/g.35061  ORF Transcript_15582/g.35061 Transcript_15582/m.35061 type:complete len:790 (-) Transcript_15582:5189-7558(-)